MNLYNFKNWKNQKNSFFSESKCEIVDPQNQLKYLRNVNKRHTLIHFLILKIINIGT